jgi:hypothetical protein
MWSEQSKNSIVTPQHLAQLAYQKQMHITDSVKLEFLTCCKINY